MSKESIITKLVNIKPLSITRLNTKQNEDGSVIMNYTETYISQMVKARDEQEFSYICSQIQEFIEKENIDVCFVINKDNLVDCLQEHQKLKFEIAELEAKLAEKDLRIEELESQFAYECECNKQFVECQNENEKLKQQLAELDSELAENVRENEYLKEQLAEKEEQINMLEEHKFYADNIIQAYADKCKQHNQDKISFGVEQLEKVKEFVKENESWEIEGSDYSIVYADDVLEQIDNQIKHLKEGK